MVSQWLRKKLMTHHTMATPIGSDDQETLYRVTRSYLETEANLIANRTNWLFASNAFLFSAFAGIAAKDDRVLGQVRGIVVSLGCAMSLGSFLLIAAAIVVSYQLQWSFEDAMTPKNGDADSHWATMDHRRPDLRGSKWPNRVGLWVPALLAAGLIVMWVFLANVE